MYYPGIEKKADQILGKANIKKPPVSIKKVLESIDLKFKLSNLGEKISGVLVIKNGAGTIGVNISESSVRQRFTLAHELGHFILHSKKQDQLFVDEYMYRSEESTTGEHRREREANAFAAAILMPKNLIEEEIKKRELDVSHEDAINELAKIFKVSTVAMTYRITNLKLI